jgi:hypothetical protein
MSFTYIFTGNILRRCVEDAAVSHIPQFGDVDVSEGMRISKGDDATPVGNDRISKYQNI